MERYWASILEARRITRRRALQGAGAIAAGGAAAPQGVPAAAVVSTFDREWRRWLHDGVMPDTAFAPKTVSVQASASVKGSAAGTHYQFERQGYFTVDKDSAGDRLVFNRSVGLKDSWAKEQKK